MLEAIEFHPLALPEPPASRPFRSFDAIDARPGLEALLLDFNPYDLTGACMSVVETPLVVLSSTEEAES